MVRQVCVPAAHGGPLWIRYPPTCSPWRTPRWSMGMPERGCDPMGRLCSPSWQGPHTGAGKWVWGVLPLRRKERQWTQPHSPFPCTTGREEVEEVCCEVKFGKKGRVRENFFKVWFYFSLFYSGFLWQDIRLLCPHWVCFVCNGKWWVISSILSLLLWYFSPVHLRKGVIEQLWWAPSVLSSQPTHSACKSSTGLLWNHSFPVCPDTEVLGHVEFNEVHTGTLLKPVKVPRDGIPSTKCISCTTEPGVPCQLAKGVLNSAVSLIKTLNRISPNKFPQETLLDLDTERLTAALWVWPSRQFPFHWMVQPSHPYLPNVERQRCCVRLYQRP